MLSLSVTLFLDTIMTYGQKVAPSEMPRGISGTSSTAPGRRYGVRLRSTFRKSRLNMTMKDDLIPAICNELAYCKSIEGTLAQQMGRTVGWYTRKDDDKESEQHIV
jgi:hypothetical protein